MLDPTFHNILKSSLVKCLTLKPPSYRQLIEPNITRHLTANKQQFMIKIKINNRCNM